MVLPKSVIRIEVKMCQRAHLGLNIMENETVFKDLLFGEGDGTLKYYFWNFVCPHTEPKDLSLVLM